MRLARLDEAPEKETEVESRVRGRDWRVLLVSDSES